MRLASGVFFEDALKHVPSVGPMPKDEEPARRNEGSKPVRSDNRRTE
jgi:hypothetical protein